MDTFCANTVNIWRFIGEIIYIIRIIIPIIIILLGTLDLGKAVMSGEEKTVKEAQKNFIKRLIYGVAIFFVFVIVEVIFGLLGVETDKGDTKVCWDCATKPHNKTCIKYVREQEKKEDEAYDNNYHDDEDKSYGEEDENSESSDDEKLDEM